MRGQLKLFHTCYIAAILFTISCNPEKESKSNNHKVADSVKASARGNEYETVDQSPLDISYYPADFTQKKMAGSQTSDQPVARVIYSRPHKKGRIIFGDEDAALCRYGVPWRLGANEATEIEFFQPVVITGKNIAAGRYVLYAIPHPDKWVVVLNSNIYSWGLQMDPAKDINRTEVITHEQRPAIEDFTMVFQKAPYGADLLMTWDNVKTSLPIMFTEM